MPTAAARAVLNPVLIHDDHLLPLDCGQILFTRRIPRNEVVCMVVNQLPLEDPAMQLHLRLDGVPFF